MTGWYLQELPWFDFWVVGCCIYAGEDVYFSVDFIANCISSVAFTYPHEPPCSRSEIWKSFFFDHVWRADANQAEVFADIEPMIVSVLDGYHACILAFGQTGSGKTFTMVGSVL
jgi:hypothetical protein